MRIKFGPTNTTTLIFQPPFTVRLSTTIIYTHSRTFGTAAVHRIRGNKLTWPVEHLAHGLEPPPVLPGGHDIQRLFPLLPLATSPSFANLPGGQFLQPDLPTSSWNLPASHRTQQQSSDAPGSEFGLLNASLAFRFRLPAGHGTIPSLPDPLELTPILGGGVGMGRVPGQAPTATAISLPTFRLPGLFVMYSFPSPRHVCSNTPTAASHLAAIGANKGLGPIIEPHGNLSPPGAHRTVGVATPPAKSLVSVAHCGNSVACATASAAFRFAVPPPAGRAGIDAPERAIYVSRRMEERRDAEENTPEAS